jgi:hypothetical protein
MSLTLFPPWRRRLGDGPGLRVWLPYFRWGLGGLVCGQHASVEASVLRYAAFLAFGKARHASLRVLVSPSVVDVSMGVVFSVCPIWCAPDLVYVGVW